MYLDLVFGFENKYLKETERKPFKKLELILDNIVSDGKAINDEPKYLMNKLEDSLYKFMMALKAGNDAIESEKIFISSQNRTCPSLFGDDEVEILFFVEAMILFYRASLDIFSTFISKILFGTRIDSFNKFHKKLLKTENIELERMRAYLEKVDDEVFSWLKVLVGSEKGRSLRDQLVHQKKMNIFYSEYVEESEKEKCFIEYQGTVLPFDEFINYMTISMKDFYYFTEDFIIEDINLENTLFTKAL